MNGFLVRLAITAVGLWAASTLVSGITVSDTTTLLIAALGLGIVNAVVRPIFVVMTIPITILSLGLFLWVINAAMLSLVAWGLDGFNVVGFWSALAGAMWVSITAWIGNAYIGDGGRYEVVVTRPRS